MLKIEQGHFRSQMFYTFKEQTHFLDSKEIKIRKRYQIASQIVSLC